jgi:hypothetical protein
MTTDIAIELHHIVVALHWLQFELSALCIILAFGSVVRR